MNKHFFATALLSLGLATTLQAQAPAPTQDDVILHAWCWSFNTIRENLADIAAAGYQIVQTPPAQNCIHEAKGDKGGGPQLFGHGRWYYHYQPIDWQIGNYQVGTREDLIRLCDEARKYGIKIIVDVLPNHTAIDDTRVSDMLDAAVGGHENLYHATGFDEISDYNDRLQCTTGQMGGLPDVNTENPDFQHYFLLYLNDLIRCGVRGFRYDTAKHIGLPSDPKDSRSVENDFWPVVTGQKAVKGLSLALPMDSLFVYGEVLQDRNTKDTEYTEFFPVTASSLGYVVRNDLDAASWLKDDPVPYNHPSSPDRLVTWVESHDTYCNEHVSAHLSDQQIRLGWVFLTARQHGTPLFYSRPNGSDGPAGNYWGDNLVGARGNDNFRHPLVVAANSFRRKMHGQPESLNTSTNGAVLQVARGRKGTALVNISNEAQTIDLTTTLPNGTYRDALSGNTFKVRKGRIQGTLQPMSAYLLVK